MSETASGCTPCHDCGADYYPQLGTYWLASDELWGEVVGREDIALCPACFVGRAHAVGLHVHLEAVFEHGGH